MKWTDKGYRDLSALFDSMVYIAHRDHIQRVTGIEFSFKARKHHNKRIYSDEEELDRFCDVVKQMHFQDPHFIVGIAHDCFKQCRLLILLGKQLREQAFEHDEASKYASDIGALPDKAKQLTELKQMFDTYIHQHLTVLVYLFTLAYGIEKLAFETISAEIAQRVKNAEKRAYYIAALTSPARESYSFFEEIGLLKIAIAVKSDKLWPKQLSRMNDNGRDIRFLDKELQDLLNAHCSKYAWINTRHFLGRPWTVSDFVKRLKTSIKQDCAGRYKQLKRQKEERETEFNAAVRDLNIKGDLLQLVCLFREFVYLRTFRKDAMTLSAYYVRPVFDKVAQALGIDYETLVSLTAEEIPLMLDKLIESERRKVKFSSVMQGGVITYYSGDRAKQLDESSTVDIPEIKELKGMIANPGKAKGAVNLIFRRNDVAKMRVGDVLVTTMSTPDFVEAIEKCSAIVTDEGGITCHAAIVSRELGKPCVTGTKIATKVFHDGDIVEVDADKGIVRRVD